MIAGFAKFSRLIEALGRSAKRKPASVVTIVVAFLAILVCVPKALALDITIEIETVAESALEAKTKAMQEAPKKAFAAFARAGVASSKMDKVVSLFAKHEGELVESFTVLDEATTPRKYSAKLRYSLRYEVIVELFANNNIPFVEEDAPAILVVPYVRQDGVLQFDHKGHWYQLWCEQGGKAGRFSYSIPARPDQLALFDEVTLAMSLEEQAEFLGVRFGVWSVVFAVFERGERPSLLLTGADSVGPVTADFAVSGLRGVPEAGLAESFEKALLHLEDRWKEAAAQPIGSLDSVIQRVRIPFLTGKGEWPRFANSLRDMPGVLRLDLDTLNDSYAEASLLVSGDFFEFSQLMRSNFIVIDGEDGVWVVRPFN